MADRRLEEDGSDPNRRRQHGLATSSSSRSTLARSRVTDSSQQARSSRSTAAEPSARASTSQSQQAAMMAVNPQHTYGTQRGESSGYRAGEMRSVAVTEGSSDSSEDGEDEDGSDDNGEQGERDTSSRQRRSDSIITTQDFRALQERAHAAVKRLREQGYPEDQAVAAVRQKFKETLGGEHSTRGSDTRQGSESRGGTYNDAVLRDRLPGHFTGPLSWKGRELGRGSEIVKLGSSDIESVKSAIAQYKG
jgi:hypothetical protein